MPGSGHSDDAAALAAHPLRRHVAPATTPPSAPGCGEGDTVAVVGDGAVGLSAVLAANRLGAERIIALSRHADRQQLARTFGATDIVEARGDDADAAVLELTDGIGVDAALECVGTGQSISHRVRHRPARLDRRDRRRPARRRGPVRPDVLPQRRLARRPRPGAASTSPSCSPTSSTGAIDPGLVLDFETDLDGIAEAYAAMDERRAIKSLVRIGSV